MKIKLQIKLNKNELKADDKESFKNISSHLEKNLKEYNEKNENKIVWKGVYYEWVTY